MGGDFIIFAIILALKTGLMSYWYRAQLYPGKWAITILSLIYVFILYAFSALYRLFVLYVDRTFEFEYIINFYAEGSFLFGTAIATLIEIGIFSIFYPSNTAEKLTWKSLLHINGILLGLFIFVLLTIKLLS